MVGQLREKKGVKVDDDNAWHQQGRKGSRDTTARRE